MNDTVKAKAAEELLQASPVRLPALPQNESVAGRTTVLPRQVWVMGLATIVAGVILKLLSTYAGLDFEVLANWLAIEPALVRTGLAVVIAALITKWVPPSVTDLVKNLTDDTVEIAMADPQSNVSYVQIPAQPPPGEAARIPPAKTG